jgi:hypothetical protein
MSATAQPLSDLLRRVVEWVKEAEDLRAEVGQPPAAASPRIDKRSYHRVRRAVEHVEDLQARGHQVPPGLERRARELLAWFQAHEKAADRAREQTPEPARKKRKRRRSEAAQCPHCEERLPPSRFAAHVRSAHGRRVVRCRQCLREVRNDILDVHLRRECDPENGLSRCSLCGSFVRRQNVDAHRRKHTRNEIPQPSRPPGSGENARKRKRLARAISVGATEQIERWCTARTKAGKRCTRVATFGIAKEQFCAQHYRMYGGDVLDSGDGLA